MPPSVTRPRKRLSNLDSDSLVKDGCAELSALLEPKRVDVLDPDRLHVADERADEAVRITASCDFVLHRIFLPMVGVDVGETQRSKR